jgi:hypothetical protein
MATYGIAWMTSLLKVLDTQVNAKNINDVNNQFEELDHNKPTDPSDVIAATKKFLEKSGTGSVKTVGFLQKMSLTYWKCDKSANSQFAVKTRMFLYNILLHLTSSGVEGDALARSLVAVKVCEEIRRDVWDNMGLTSEFRVRIMVILESLLNIVSSDSMLLYLNL